MLYLYAITDAGKTLPPVRGIAGAAIGEIVQRELAAVYSVHADGEMTATEDTLWQHEQVAEALMDDRAVLPVRFGVVFRDEAAVAAELERRHGSLSASLDRVRGRVELGVRVLRPDAQPARAVPAGRETTGRSYLTARLERLRSARAVAEELERELGPFAVASTRRVLDTPRLLVSSAYLVDRDQVGAFREQVDQLTAVHDDLSFLCTGPWPAYSFVGQAAETE